MNGATVSRDKTDEVSHIMAEWRENNPDDSRMSESDISIGSDMQSPKGPESGPLYYAVYIPPDTMDYSSSSSFEEPLVFAEKHDALKVLKQNKKARFKSFPSEEEARLWCGGGGDTVSFDSPMASKESLQFKGPKSQDLVRFRKSIQEDDLVAVRRFVDENPRYLVGSGDTPAILQEGSRYNALHIAARSNSAVVCSYLLHLISSVLFLKKLYGATNTDLEERRNILLDLYLNMPDKALNETPLHFASKLGAVQIVKILTSFPMCDRHRKNKHGSTAIEIICTRATEEMMQYKDEIHAALDVQYYVPVLRTEDNSVSPAVGEPFTHATPPTSPYQETISTPLKIKALAGPLSESEAKLFRKKWKSSTRYSPLASNRISPLAVNPALSDPYKGLEQIGRSLAKQYRIQWKEYWPFLDTFVDIASPEGLTCLENYLKREFKKHHFSCETPLVTPIKPKDCNSSKSMDSLISRMIGLSLDSPENTDIMKTKALHSRSSPIDVCEENQIDPFDLAIRKDSPHFFEAYQHVMFKSPKCKSSLVGTVTMEKSCQVFASRIGVALINGMKSNVLSEIGRFQLFLGGCTTDERFRGTDLQKAHYRLSVLINEKILSISDDRQTIVSNLCDMMSSELKYSVGDRKLSLENLIQATICICRCSIALLSCSSSPHKLMNSQDVEPDVLWSVAESCGCSLPTIRCNRSRLVPRTLFKDDAFDKHKAPSIEKDLPASPEKNGACGNSEKLLLGLDEEMKEINLSGSPPVEEEYHTAPSSPIGSCSPVSSEEDLVPSETGPDIFLAGDKPTQLDKSVLEAITNVNLSLKTHPHIVLWKYACQEYTKKTPCERWGTPVPPSRRKRHYFDVCSTPC